MSIFVGVMCDHRGEACVKQFFPIETKDFDDGDLDECYTAINDVTDAAWKEGWRFKGVKACCPSCYLMDKPE